MPAMVAGILISGVMAFSCSVTAILHTDGGPVVLTVNSTGDDLTKLAPS